MTASSSIDILSHLVGFDTVSDKSNLELIEWVEGYLGGLGVKSRRVYDADGSKANLLATIGPEGVPGYVLSGHTDVVPVVNQPWTRDPFKLEIEGSRAYGRGTTDMKGFDACILAKVPAMLAAGLSRPITLALSYDEEVGCRGVRGIIKEMPGWPVQPLGVFVGEPTSMDVVIAHKGKVNFRVTVYGSPAHSSLAPTAVNAVEYAADLVVKIRDIGRRLRAHGPRDELFDIAHTTAHVGQLHGGTILNIVPETCWFDWEFRFVPKDDAEALVAEVKAYASEVLEPQMREVFNEARIEFVPMSGLPALDMAPEDPLTVLAKRLAGRNAHGKVAYGTEAGPFQQEGGIPAIICGPGNIEQAHKPDEYIEIAELVKCEAFIDKLIAHCRA